MSRAGDDQPTVEASGRGSDQPATQVPSQRVPATWVGRTWVAIAAAIASLVVAVVFILQNLQTVRASFFGLHWSAPLAVDLLLAAALGGLVVFLVGTVRIVQLRRLARRRRTPAADA